MLLQTNSYIVPKEKRSEHARLMRRFKQVLGKLGCDMFEIYEQVGPNWNGTDTSGRYVQIMRFRDRKHQVAVQNAERNDPNAQALIAEFCDLVNFPYQQQQGFFAVGFYNSVLPTPTSKVEPLERQEEPSADPDLVEAASFAQATVPPEPEPSMSAAGDFGPPAEMVEGELVSQAHYPPTATTEPEPEPISPTPEELEDPLMESATGPTDESTALAELPETLDGESGGLESESVRPEEIAADRESAGEPFAPEATDSESLAMETSDDPSAIDEAVFADEHEFASDAEVEAPSAFGDGELEAQDTDESHPDPHARPHMRLHEEAAEGIEEELIVEPHDLAADESLEQPAEELSEETLTEEHLASAGHGAPAEEHHGEAEPLPPEPVAEVAVEPEPERRSLFRRRQR